MKKTKIIIPALGLLLLSTAASVTGTVAWFAANATVTATGMEITAKTDSVFLEIKGSEDNSFGTVGHNAVDAEVFPVAHETISTVAGIESFTNNWYYQYSDDPASYNSNLGAKTYIAAFTNYVIKTTYQVQLHQGSADTAYDLYVSKVTLSSEVAGISMIVAGADGFQEFSASAASITYDNALVISDEVTSTAQTISVYLYINGNNANVYSNNLAALTGTVEFQLTAFAANHA